MLQGIRRSRAQRQALSTFAGHVMMGAIEGRYTHTLKPRSEILRTLGSEGAVSIDVSQTANK